MALPTKNEAKSLIRNETGSLTNQPKMFTLPEHLLGGSYFGKTSEPTPTPLARESLTYGGLPTKKDYERDHIISIFLSGTDEPSNVRYRATGSKFAERQEGKVAKENELYNRYRKGEISRAEAITELKRWEFEKELEQTQNSGKDIINVLVDTAKVLTKGIGLFTEAIPSTLKFANDLRKQIKQNNIELRKVAFDTTGKYTEEEKQKALIEVTMLASQIGGIGFVTEKEAQKLISQAVKLTRKDLIEITRGALTSGPKYEAYKTMTANPALKKELLAIAKNEKISLGEKIVNKVKSIIDDLVVKSEEVKPTGTKSALIKTGEVAKPLSNLTKTAVAKELQTLKPLLQEANWNKLQETNPDLFNKGILRKSLNPKDAKGVIPENIHSIQGKWQNYGEFDEISADKIYKRIDSGSFKGEYEDKFGNPVRNEDGSILQDIYDNATGEWIKPMVSNKELRNELLDAFSTKEGKQYLDEVINALPKNPDGTITAYRIGKIGGGEVQSYTLSEGMAKTFSNQGTSVLPAGTPGLPAKGYKDFGELLTNIVKIDPKGIKAWNPYDAEILVEPKYVKTKSQLTDIWEKAHGLPAVKRPTTTKGRAIAEFKTEQAIKNEQRELLASIKEGIVQGFVKEKNQLRKQIGFERKTKELDNAVLFRARQLAGITEWSNATKEQLQKVLVITKNLEKGDRFLTEKQLEGLKDYVATFDKEPGLVTQREVQERFKEREEIMDGYISGKISNNLFPTVDIKESSKVISRVVDLADYNIRIAKNRAETISQRVSDLLSDAEKEVGKTKAGEDIFKAMSGENINFTENEQKVVDILKKYFEYARKNIGLEKYRKNYITNLDKTFLEKLSKNNWNLLKTINSYRPTPESDIPIDIMLALDNIIGSEKFFRFGLERKGGIDPTTNIRRIIKTYSSIVENKMALDKILPEGQAAVRLLLQPKSAKWLQSYLKNLKGRGLDYNARNGKMGWLMKGADGVVDFGYFRLLALNYWSALKNIVGGESNSLIFQTFDKYLTGKKRLLTAPIKSYNLIQKFGLLDGSYVDILDRSVPSRIKRAVDLAMYGGMEAAEYEIRGSYMLGELTKEEWKTGEITPRRFREIMDGIAITQGIYTKVDSPLFVQTTLGRSMMQFGRWKITNLMLARRLLKGAKAEFKTGEKYGKNTRGLLKLLGVYMAGTYLSYEAGKAGMKKVKSVAEASTEVINIVLNFFDEVMSSLTENPALSTLDYFSYNLEWLLYYIGVKPEPPKQIKFRNTELYFSSINTLFGSKEKEKKSTTKSITTPSKIKLPSKSQTK